MNEKNDSPHQEYHTEASRTSKKCLYTAHHDLRKNMNSGHLSLTCLIISIS